MLASSRKPCDAANPKRRAKTPALHCGREQEVADKRQPSAKPADGPMQASAPTQRGDTPQLSSTCRACRPRLCRPYALHCRAGVHARRGGSRRPGGVLVRPCAAPLSRLTPTAPLAGEPFKRQALYKASPARGCGVERRLRRRKRDGAGAAVAEHKRASARAVRCGHRKPDGRCAARRRRRGALPVCDGNILQSPAGPCPRIRRGRCLHRPGTPATPPSSAAGEIALQGTRKRATTDKHQPSARPANGPMLASAPTQGVACGKKML